MWSRFVIIYDHKKIAIKICDYIYLQKNCDQDLWYDHKKNYDQDLWSYDHKTFLIKNLWSDQNVQSRVVAKNNLQGALPKTSTNILKNGWSKLAHDHLRAQTFESRMFQLASTNQNIEVRDDEWKAVISNWSLVVVVLVLATSY